MRRRVESTLPPIDVDVGTGLRWLVAHGASFDELYAWWEANEDFDIPDPRLSTSEVAW